MLSQRRKATENLEKDDEWGGRGVEKTMWVGKGLGLGWAEVEKTLGGWGNSGKDDLEGQEKVVKVVVDDINKEKRLVTFKAFEGHVIEEYKAFKATLHIENKGDNNLVIWTIEYEKQNEHIPEPFSYLQLATNITKDVDTHHVNQ
uniref:Major latex n=1 Tax=Solanum tuberosum TaxID=4113 RepID=M1BFP6_SOLTU